MPYDRITQAPEGIYQREVRVRWTKDSTPQPLGADPRSIRAEVRVELIVSLADLREMTAAAEARAAVGVHDDGKPIVINADETLVVIGSANLNRAAINRLVKTARTARDQAYGRDE